jgi:hypothetical protein
MEWWGEAVNRRGKLREIGKKFVKKCARYIKI